MNHTAYPNHSIFSNRKNSQHWEDFLNTNHFDPLTPLTSPP